MKDLIITFQNALNTPDNSVEKSTAQFFLGRLGVKDIQISEVAQACFTSQSTISRLVRQWGYESYNDMIVSFENISIDAGELYYDLISINDVSQLHNRQWIDHGLDDLANGFVSWKDSFPLDDVIYLAKRIVESRKVVLFGILMPGHYLENLQYFLLHLGIQCIYYSDPENHLKAVAELNEKDCAIIASLEGNYISKYPEVMIALRETETLRILITQNPVVKYNTYVSKTIHLGTPTVPRISKMRLAYFIDLLVNYVYLLSKK